MFFPTCVHILGVVVPVLFLFPNERQEIAEKQETFKKTNGFKKKKKMEVGLRFPSLAKKKKKKRWYQQWGFGICVCHAMRQ